VPPTNVILSQRAKRDIESLGRLTGKLVARALSGELATTAPEDVRPLAGLRGWYALRVGNFYVLFRELDEAELPMNGTRGPARLVAAIVRRDELASFEPGRDGAALSHSPT
jgi:mRNA-degrading endonuclease RelE of RelBE toxin-antitoxin system